jgi:hypothetical protein
MGQPGFFLNWLRGSWHACSRVGEAYQSRFVSSAKNVRIAYRQVKNQLLSGDIV